jgi:hypothetical protein
MPSLRRLVPVVVGVAIGVVAGVLVARASGADPPAVFATADLDALAAAVPRPLGTGCVPASAQEADRDRRRDSAFADDPRALAIVACQPTGTGAQTLYAWRFATSDGVQARMDQWRTSFYGAHGWCDPGIEGSTGWADERGRRRGDVQCDARDGVTYVAWSDAGARIVYEASASSALPLLQWWRTRVRALGDFPTAAERELLERAKEEIDTSACRRDTYYGAPLAVAAILCTDPTDAAGGEIGAQELRLMRFSAPELLGAAWRDFVARWGRGASGEGEEHCGVNGNPAHRDVWYDDAGELRGQVLCFPALGQERVGWTLDDANVLGIVERTDQDVAATVEAWRRVRELAS